MNLSLNSDNIGILLDDFFEAEKAKETIEMEVSMARRDLDSLMERRKKAKAWIELRDESGKMALVRAVIKDWILKEPANWDYLVFAGITDEVTVQRIRNLKMAWNVSNAAYYACFQDMNLLANMHDSILFDDDLAEVIEKYYQSEYSNKTLERLIRESGSANAPWFDSKKLENLKARVKWYYRNPNIFTMNSIECGLNFKGGGLYKLQQILEGQIRWFSTWDHPDDWQAFQDIVYDWEQSTRFFDPELQAGNDYLDCLVDVRFFDASEEAKELENNVIISERETAEES